MLINCTPHEVTFLSDDRTVTIPSSGIVPRVVMRDNPTGNNEYVGTADCRTLRVPLTETRAGRVEGLPEPRPDTRLIVSRLVAEACPDRWDLVVPDGLVRDERGVITGSTRLARVLPARRSLLRVTAHWRGVDEANFKEFASATFGVYYRGDWEADVAAATHDPVAAGHIERLRARIALHADVESRSLESGYSWSEQDPVIDGVRVTFVTRDTAVAASSEEEEYAFDRHVLPIEYVTLGDRLDLDGQGERTYRFHSLPDAALETDLEQDD